MSEQVGKTLKDKPRSGRPLLVELCEKLNVIEKAENMRDNSARKLGKELHLHNSKFRAQWHGDI